MPNFIEADLTYLEDLSGGNNGIIVDIIQLFLQQTPGDFDTLIAHIQSENWEAAYKMAHHIKPTLAYVGANDMRDELNLVERTLKSGTELDTIMPRLEGVKIRLETLYAELKQYLAAL
jgi:HPt (histidine-containing phosphotransfer) domain-containing protein